MKIKIHFNEDSKEKRHLFMSRICNSKKGYLFLYFEIKFPNYINLAILIHQK